MRIHFNNQPKHLEGVMTLAQEELSRLERYSDRIEKADIFYQQIQDPVNSHKVEIRLALPGPTAFAHDEAESFSKAFIQCMDKLENQLKKRRSYHQDRK